MCHNIITTSMQKWRNQPAFIAAAAWQIKIADCRWCAVFICRNIDMNLIKIWEKAIKLLNSFLLTRKLIWIYVTFDWLLAQNIDTFRSIIVKRSDHSVLFMFSVVFHINCPNFFSPSVLSHYSTDWSQLIMCILIDIQYLRMYQRIKS